MKEFFARLNSTERRFVVAVLVVVFLVVNVLFVWPRFNDWTAMQNRHFQASKKLADRKKIIADAKALQPKLTELERESPAIPLVDQTAEFMRVVTSQAAESGVTIISDSPLRKTGATNAFFTEQMRSIQTQSGETNLVDFLYKLGAGSSLIRVRDMALYTDPNRYTLQANIQLVASFQKMPTVRTPTPTNTPAVKSTATAPRPSVTNSPPRKSP